MPHTIEVPSVNQGFSWQYLRKGLRECILTVAPTARVYSSWPLKYDIGETVNLLRSSADSNKIHSWIIGINRAEPFKENIGGKSLKWDLDIRIWGFVGYESIHDDSVQNTIEDECRLISQVMHLNQKHFGLEDTSPLSGNSLVVWEDIDVHSFGSGQDVHVAQGLLTITLNENYN